ncbi:MAG: VWA domain-containing protein [Planctomycetes bacterium]|nr:VWA domain-containing protein [Planctomycetota bacterium]
MRHVPRLPLAALVTCVGLAVGACDRGGTEPSVPAHSEQNGGGAAPGRETVPGESTDAGPQVAGQPVLQDVETEVEELTEEGPAPTRESAFDSNQWNSAIGLGGGGGGKYGGRADLGTEDYAAIAEHGWCDPRREPLSTFAIDVDGGSFSNARRFLDSGRLPPADAVRVEEFVNWFRYATPGAADVVGDHPLAVATELLPCPWRPDHQLLRVALHAPPVARELVPPCNLVFLVDVSGSMRPADKLPLLKRGLLLLARQLRPQDHVAIVTYAGSSGVLLPPTAGAERQAIEDAIDSLGAGGSTNGASGIREAYRLAREGKGAETIDRVILATDGDFNVGVTDRDELLRLIEDQRDHGVFLTVLGFGTGNLKEATLEQLADHGNGQYAYIDSIDEARRVLVDQSGATLVTVAKDAKIQIEFNPRFVARYRQVGYENRELAAADFNDDRKDGGEIGAGHCVTALYEIVPVGVEPPVPAVDPLRYQEPQPAAQPAAAGDGLDPTALATELALVKVRYKHPDADRSERFEVPVAARSLAAGSGDAVRAAAAAAFGMLLRSSPHLAPGYGYDAVLALLATAEGPDPDGDWAGLARLVRMARDLAATEPSSR